jgi:hypothetical protein
VSEPLDRLLALIEAHAPTIGVSVPWLHAALQTSGEPDYGAIGALWAIVDEAGLRADPELSAALTALGARNDLWRVIQWGETATPAMRERWAASLEAGRPAREAWIEKRHRERGET